jgi:hypothetical protein
MSSWLDPNGVCRVHFFHGFPFFPHLTGTRWGRSDLDSRDLVERLSALLE